GVVTMYTRGGTGVDEGDAGDGGSATLTNTGAVTLSGTTSAGSVQSLISVSSVGGNGDDHNDNNDSDGGDGGNGGELSIRNSGILTIEGSVQPYTVNGSTRTDQAMFGIRAVSGGGTGGDQNGSIFGDQVGGKGGSGGTINVSNQGAIRIGSTASRLQG